jgi:uncharacterized protein YgfB (UPF0149 family)
MTMLTVTFDELETALAAGDARISAAEGHGSLCGSLSALSGFDAADWLSEILPEGGEHADEAHPRELLETLFSETRSALDGQMMEFEPLLPDDSQPLERRTAALAEWCSGFMFGMARANFAPGEEMPEAASEVLKDFAELARASVDPEDSDDGNETAYAELVEYLRVSVQLVYDELAEHRGEPTEAA